MKSVRREGDQFVPLTDEELAAAAAAGRLFAARDGMRVLLPVEEEAAIKAQWAEEEARPKPPPAADSVAALRADLDALRARLDALASK
jgi:hypothetical protein